MADSNPYVDDPFGEVSDMFRRMIETVERARAVMLQMEIDRLIRICQHPFDDYNDTPSI